MHFYTNYFMAIQRIHVSTEVLGTVPLNDSPFILRMSTRNVSLIAPSISLGKDADCLDAAEVIDAAPTSTTSEVWIWKEHSLFFILVFIEQTAQSLYFIHFNPPSVPTSFLLFFSSLQGFPPRDFNVLFDEQYCKIIFSNWQHKQGYKVPLLDQVSKAYRLGKLFYLLLFFTLELVGRKI